MLMMNARGFFFLFSLIYKILKWNKQTKHPHYCTNQRTSMYCNYWKKKKNICPTANRSKISDTTRWLETNYIESFFINLDSPETEKPSHPPTNHPPNPFLFGFCFLIWVAFTLEICDHIKKIIGSCLSIKLKFMSFIFMLERLLVSINWKLNVEGINF